MSNRCFTLLGTGLLAVVLPLGALHADRPPERDPAPAPALEITSLAAETDPELPHPDRIDADPEPPAPSSDADADIPSELTPDVDPVAEDAELESALVAEAEAEAEETDLAAEVVDEPEEETGPIKAPVSVAPVLHPIEVESGPPPLQQADLDGLTARLLAIEEKLAGQQQRALEMVVSSNRTALIVAGTFAGIGVLAILIAALVLARILNRFSDVVMTLPAGQPLGRAAAIPWPGSEGPHPATSTTVEHVSARFLGAIEQLEKRIRELEQLPQPRANRGGAGNGARQPAPAITSPAETNTPGPEMASVALDAAVQQAAETPHLTANRANERHLRVEELLVEGENLLQHDNFEGALERFEDALVLAPRHADALIKRGMALERLQRMEAALESYDRAIASNGSLTLAYLHKGAVCNRLQRYREALECYERALQTEHKS